MEHITSRTHPLIQKIASLHTPKGRTAAGLCFAEGQRTCSTLISYGWQPRYVCMTREFHQQHQSIFTGQTVYIVDDHVMEKISVSKSASGILAVFPIPSNPSVDLISAGIVLHSLSDPGNIGTLIRTTAAMGAHTVVIIGGADIWSPKIIQASAGTIAAVHIFVMTWQELLANKNNATLAALTVSEGSHPSTLPKETLLIVGNEAHGIPQAHVAQADCRISLPMPGKTESLNAAIAGSIALYELFTHSRS